jgi:phage terminase large subunit GpA-like protein
MKSVQCGISEFLIIVTFCEMMRGHFVIYSFPTDDDCKDVVHNRIDYAVDRVPIYRKGRGRVDNVGIKRFWGGGMLAVSTMRKTAFVGTPAQCMIIDEKDRCNMENLEYADDRTAATRLTMQTEPRKITVSNPSVAGSGIHADFEFSNQQRWSYKCSGCGEWQDLNWFRNVVNETAPGKYELIDKSWSPDGSDDIKCLCWRCGKPIDRIKNKAEWIAQFPSVNISGYHISQLFTFQFTIRELWDAFNAALKNTMKMQIFYNSKLGLPFSGSGVKLSDEDIRRCIDDDYTAPQESEWTVAGVDVGTFLNVAIDEMFNGMRKAVFRGSVSDWDELKNLLHRFNSRCTVIDAAPELHAAREFQKHNKRYGVILCEYTSNDSAATAEPVITERYNPGMGNYPNKYSKVDRTSICDEMVEWIRDGRVIYPANIMTADKGNWIKQMKAPTRVYIERKLADKRMSRRYVWTENGQPDHAFHTEVYAHIAGKIKNFRRSSVSIMRIT